MASKFANKTKADLVAIARISGLLKTTVSQKMTKAELLAFLENAEKENLMESPKDAGTEGQREDRKSEESGGIEKPRQEKQAEPVKGKPASSPEGGKGKSKRKSTAKTKAKVVDAAKSSPAEELTETAPAETTISAEKSEKIDKTGVSGEADRAEESETESKKKLSEADSGEEKAGRSGDKSSEKTRRIKTKNNKKSAKGEAEEAEAEGIDEQDVREGILEIMPDGYGFIRIENYIQGPDDLYLPPQYIRRFKLRNGDHISGPARQQRDNDRYPALYYIKEVNGQSPDKMMKRPNFERLTPIYANERLVLETSQQEISCRIIDLVSPIGKGQRGMIVSPPKAGKTVLLKKIANAITANSPKTKLLVLLIDERPEEVTDMQRSIKGEVVYSTFDKSPENHVKITELVLERAKRMVELGEDVVILLDSITRMGRAYNLTINPTGRTLSGGLDPGALYGPKRFFGAARNIEEGGSLTIIATALVDTGSRMDEVIFEEFKGTGNMEVYLDRKLAEKRVFPAIDMIKSGTRREELLLSKGELDAIWGIRRAFGHLETSAVTESLISLMLKTKSNAQFVASINISLNDQQLFDAMRTSMGSSNSNGSNGSSNGYSNGNSY